MRESAVQEKEKPATVNYQNPAENIVTNSLTERKEEFSNNSFLQAYNKFVETLREDKPRLYIALNSQQAEIKEQSLGLSFANNTQLDDFNKNIRSDLIIFLRDELKNDSIVIKTTITEQSDKNILYTPEDKYKHLLAKNPSLGKLKQQFNLDLE